MTVLTSQLQLVKDDRAKITEKLVDLKEAITKINIPSATEIKVPSTPLKEGLVLDGLTTDYSFMYSLTATCFKTITALVLVGATKLAINHVVNTVIIENTVPLYVLKALIHLGLR